MQTRAADAQVLLQADGSVALVTLANARARNALSCAMLDALSQRLDDIARRSELHVVVIQAEGLAFCAGHDLKELTAHRADSDGGRAFFEATMAACARVMQQIVALPQPVIAAVDGMATAAGCQLVATCDLAVAGPQARFCTPGVDIGLFCSTPAVALARNLARKHALDMLFTGDVVDAEAALRLGLVNRLAPEGARAGALTLARRIATKSPEAIALGKRTFYAQAELPLSEAYRTASAAMVANLLLDDAREGIDAFLGKRAPHWGAKPAQ